MKKFALGLIVGVCLVPACVYVYFRLGYAPVATAAAPLPFEKSLTRMALHARIDKEAPSTAPMPANEANLTAGAQVYREHCAVCHGISGEPLNAIAKGMFPRPPHLLHGTGVTDDPVGETYWKATNGIRLTGMPAFRGALTDQQLWQVCMVIDM